MITWLARSQRTYLNGPMPIGLALYGTLLMLGYCANRCLGSRHGFAPPVEKNVSTNGEYGFFICRTTVFLSGALADAIKSQPVRPTSLLAGLRTTAIENSTSSAVNRTPSDHLTFGRR